MDPSPGTWASDEVCSLCCLACGNLGEHSVERSGILETRRAGEESCQRSLQFMQYWNCAFPKSTYHDDSRKVLLGVAIELKRWFLGVSVQTGTLSSRGLSVFLCLHLSTVKGHILTTSMLSTLQNWRRKCVRIYVCNKKTIILEISDIILEIWGSV